MDGLPKRCASPPNLLRSNGKSISIKTTDELEGWSVAGRKKKYPDMRLCQLETGWPQSPSSNSPQSYSSSGSRGKQGIRKSHSESSFNLQSPERSASARQFSRYSPASAAGGGKSKATFFGHMEGASAFAMGLMSPGAISERPTPSHSRRSLLEVFNIPGRSEKLTLEPGTKIFPVSELMTGDVGHLVAYGLLNPKTHFLLLTSGELEYANDFKRIDEELSFFCPDRITTITLPRPHSLYSDLTNEENSKKYPDYSSFYRAGYATSQIGKKFQKGIKTQPYFQTCFSNLIEQHSEAINDYCSCIGISSRDTSIPKVFFWGRNSGRSKGIHHESDTTSHFLNLLYDAVKESKIIPEPYQSIFTGSKNRTGFDKGGLASAFEDTLTINLFEFWGSESFKELRDTIGIPSGILQLLLFHKLDRDGHKAIHFSNRSGTIDKLSFILSEENNRFVEFVASNFDNGRLESLNSCYIHTYGCTPVSPIGRVLEDAVNRAKAVASRYPDALYDRVERQLKTPMLKETVVEVVSSVFEARVEFIKGTPEAEKNKLRMSNEGFLRCARPTWRELSDNPLMRSIESESEAVVDLPPPPPARIFRQISNESVDRYRGHVHEQLTQFMARQMEEMATGAES